MKQIIHIGECPIALISEDFEESINIDEIFQIDYSNLYGEAVTIPALLNKVGMMKSQAESDFSKAKLECEIYESKLRKSIRVESGRNAGKFLIDGDWVKLTEKSIDEAVYLDDEYQRLRSVMIETKKNLDLLDSLYWAVGTKSKKLDNLVKQVTPQEFVEELVEGKVNTFLIKKSKIKF